MTMAGNEETPTGCPICKSENSGTVEFNTPPVLLCECERCGKFILTKDTLLKLFQKNNVGALRYKISERIQEHFTRFMRPLQIVSDNEKPLVQDVITIGKLVSVCNGNVPAKETDSLTNQPRPRFGLSVPAPSVSPGHS